MNDLFLAKLKRQAESLCLLFFCFLFFNSPLVAAASEPDHAVDVKSVEKSDSVYMIGRNSENNLESTVTLSAKLSNMSSSYPLPFTCTIIGAQKPYRLLSLSPINSYSPWNYDYNFQWQIGLACAKRPLAYAYFFPFEKGTSHFVTQGAGGSYSHQQGSADENAIDFAMPEGTTVCAAREGEVIAFRDDSNVGGSDEKYSSYGNYIVIKHNDGSYGQYMHLKQRGVLVRLGQHIDAGLPIGLSGNTGHSSSPHLHFAAYWLTDGIARHSLPLYFRTERGVIQVLPKNTYTRDL